MNSFQEFRDYWVVQMPALIFQKNLFWTVFHKNSISTNIQVVQPRLIILILAIAERISTWQSYLTHMHTQKHLHFFKTD